MKPIQSIFVDVHGVRIHARTTPCSVAAAAPVVILHGFTGSIESMRSVETELTMSRTTVSLDLVGHGCSDSPEDVAAYTMDRCVEQIAEVIEVLALERPHLLGYSMGGRAALSFCHRYPDRVRSALLVGASAGLPDRDQRSKRAHQDEALAERIVDLGLEAFVDEWMAKPLFASQSGLGDRFLADARVERLRNNPHGLAMSLRGMGAGAMTPLELTDIKVATCFVAGAEDEKFCAIARAFGERLPHSRFQIVAGAGHAAHLENRKAFGRVARDFFAEIDAQEP